MKQNTSPTIRPESAPRPYPLVPVLVVLVTAAVTMAVILLAAANRSEWPTFINSFGLGHDYRAFYQASRIIRAGASPYTIERYVTPPLPALLNLPATFLPYDVIKYLVSALIVPAVALALFLLHRTFFAPDRRTDLVFIAATLAILSSSYPFYFLFNRGNIDGFVLLLMCIGVWALDRRDAVAGTAFAAAVAMKVYPVLVVLPLVAARRWRVLGFMAAASVALFLLAPNDALAFLNGRLFSRGAAFRITENGSLKSTFYHLGALAGGESFSDEAPTAALVGRLSSFAYAALLALVVLRDAIRKAEVGRLELCASVVLYFPFMVAVPRLAYHYELVCALAMIPVAAYQWANSSGFPRAVLCVLIAGIALTQFQSVAVMQLTDSVHPNLVPGLGLLVMLITIVVLKYRVVAEASDGNAHIGSAWVMR